MKITKKCPTCKKDYYIIKCRIETAKFCSRKCVRLSDAGKKRLSKQRKGVPKTDTWKKSASLGKLSEKNPMWKGSNAGLDAIHIWILARKPKPLVCEICKKSPPKDLANISQKYIRDVSDFEWLCRKCHMVKDGRLENLKRIRKESLLQ